MAKGNDLTNRQKRFVEEYLIDLNATQAAIRAGYSKKNAEKIGYQLLEKTRVATAIQKAQKHLSERAQISQDEIIRDLIEIKERCLQRVPVVDRKGNQIQDENGRDVWEFDAKNANRALELLGKHLGMFDNNNVNILGGLNIKVNYDDENDGNDE